MAMRTAAAIVGVLVGACVVAQTAPPAGAPGTGSPPAEPSAQPVPADPGSPGSPPVAAPEPPAAPARVTVASLLEEMVDRARFARLPSPAYRTLQASSYDRASTSRDAGESWFANEDTNHFLRVETGPGGRREWVMMEADGPGAVVRIWSANPPENATLRVYLDGAATPALETPMRALLSGEGAVPAPLAGVRAGGWSSYLPIPYARSCRVTSDADGFYYHVNYRAYEPGTDVESYSAEARAAGEASMARTVQALVRPSPDRNGEGAQPAGRRGPIEPGGSVDFLSPSGTNAIVQLRAELSSLAPAEAFRKVIVKIEFDGEETVWCPIGDFFSVVGGAPLAPFQDSWRTVAGDSPSMVARWVMPYERYAKVTIMNTMTQPVAVQLIGSFVAWTWDDRSMHFHARWHGNNAVATRPRSDFNFVDVTGEGVYMGDSLAVVNPVTEWWGEGDEKISVDGESFPSHFGTGTEDYYGYAWGRPEVFWSPFSMQAHCEGAARGVAWGRTTVARVRGLDAIPFRRSISMNMEVWHWAECTMAYAATTFFYARPGAVVNVTPAPEQVAAGVPEAPPLAAPSRVEPDVLECEALRVTTHTPSAIVGAQPLGSFPPGLWSGDAQLFVRAGNVGDFIELAVPMSAPSRLIVRPTRSWDYGKVRFLVNGRPASGDVDLSTGVPGTVEPGAEVDLGRAQPTRGWTKLRVEVVGTGTGAQPPGTYFGLDYLKVVPLQ